MQTHTQLLPYNAYQRKNPGEGGAGSSLPPPKFAAYKTVLNDSGQDEKCS